MESYLVFIYEYWEQQQQQQKQQQQLTQSNGQKNQQDNSNNNSSGDAADQELAILSDNVGRAMRENKETKG